MSEAGNESAAVIVEAESRIGEATKASEAITAAEAAVQEAKGLTGDDADEKRETVGKTLAEARQGGLGKTGAMVETMGKLVKIAQAGPGPAPNWRQEIDEEFIPLVEKFTSPADVVKSYAALQKKLGRAIVPPLEGAKPEEIDLFQTQRGRPKTPEDYKLEAPDLSDLGDGIEYNAALETFARGLFHKAGLNQQEAVVLFDGYNEFQLQSAEQLAEEDATRRAKSVADLKAEWGDEYDANRDYANRAFGVYFGADKETRDKLRLNDDTLLVDHPMMVRAMARVGRQITEAGLPPGLPDDQRQTLQARLDELHGLQTTDPTKYTTPAIQKEVQEVYAQLYGTEPMPTSGGPPEGGAPA